MLVNDERPSRATREIPRERLTAELERMRPLAMRPSTDCAYG